MAEFTTDESVLDAIHAAADAMSEIAEKLIRDAMTLSKVARDLPRKGPYGQTIGIARRYLGFEQGRHQEVAAVVDRLDASLSPEEIARRKAAADRREQEKAEKAARDLADELRTGPSWQPGGFAHQRLQERVAARAKLLWAAAQMLEAGEGGTRLVRAVDNYLNRSLGNWDVGYAIEDWRKGRRDPEPEPTVALPANVVRFQATEANNG